MKRVLSLTLALVMCLLLCCSLSACGSKDVELTLDNYKDYLDIRPYISHGDDVDADKVKFYDLNGKRCGASQAGSYFTLCASVEGVSSNFTYDDIIIEVKATGKYVACKPGDAETSTVVEDSFTLIINCDLNVSGAGEGRSTENYTIPGEMVVPAMLYAETIEFTYEIISISGKVTPVK